MLMKDLVSIIIPIYNVECYLDRCIESTVHQTYKKIEIILVDDGSLDNCPKMCDEWKKKDARIVVIHKQNGGLGSARNSGMRIANGEFLLFLDADDFLSENAVEALHSRMILDHSDMAIGKHADIYDDGTINDKFSAWMNNGVVSSDEVFHKMGDDNRYTVWACGKMFRREIYRGIEFPSLKCGEDLWIFPHIVEKCQRISVVDEICYFYYQRADSILHQPSQERIFDDIRAGVHFLGFLIEREYFKSALKWFEISLSKAMRIHDKKTVRKLFKENIRTYDICHMLRVGSSPMRAKWICLFIPALFPIMHQMKKLILKEKRL